MADWTDGPEYAPSARPDAFVDPTAEPLVTPPPPARPPVAPPQQPEFTGSATDIPLADLVAASAEQRDPHAWFTVVSTPLATLPDVPSQPGPQQPMALSGQPPSTSWAPPSQASAWGAAHAPSAPPRLHANWAPQQPMSLPDAPPLALPPGAPAAQPQVNPQGFPTPAEATWYGPQGTYPPPGPAPVGARAVVNAADPLTLTCLAAGALLPFVGLSWVAPALLVLAMVLGTQRIRLRRRAVRNTFTAATSASVVLAAIAAAEAYRPSVWAFWDALCGWSQFMCWLVVPILLGTVWSALRRGETSTG